MDKTKLYLIRSWHWIHDTVLIVGLLTIFLFLGGARAFGYYFDFALVPLELTQVSKK